jgi:hypothetical protein
VNVNFIEFFIINILCRQAIAVHDEPNDGFSALMDWFLSGWRFQRAELNQLPVRHEEWSSRD